MNSMPQPSLHGASGSASVPTVAAVPLNTTGVTVVDRYRHKQSVILGAIQVILGIACVIFKVVVLALRKKAGFYGASALGYGFWIGFTFISAGVLGIAAGKNRTKCTITGFMVMCIISAAMTTIMVFLGIVGAVNAFFLGEGRCSYNGNYQYFPPEAYASQLECDQYRALVALESCLAIAGFIVAIVSIWGAVICCQSGTCCCSGPQPAVMLPVCYYPNSGQVVFVPQAQGVQMIDPQLQVAVPFPQSMHGTSELGNRLVGPPVTYQAGFAAPPTWNSQSGSLPGNTSHGQILPPPPYQTNSHLFQQKPGQEEKI